jgi:hypothetical protein
MTLIEIKPHRWGWKVFEAPGVEPVFPQKDHAINYAQNRASFRSAEIVGSNPTPSAASLPGNVFGLVHFGAI